MKKKIYIHIGYPKTGTTTLQKHFFPYIKEIKYIGKHINRDAYFDFSSNIVNDLIFKNEHDIDFLKIKKEISNFMTKDKILLSEEDFLFECLRPPMLKNINMQPKPMEIAEKLRNIFDKEHYDVTIIMTIRKQNEMLTSLYAQAYVFNYSKYEKYNSFYKFFNIFLEGSDDFVPALDYLKVITDYESIFGKNNIKILTYEELKKSPFTFYSKLSNALEIDIFKYADVAINKIENRRITKSGYKKIYKKNMLHYVGSIKRKYFPNLSIKVHPSIKTILESISFTSSNIEKTISLTKDQEKQVLQKYKKSNHALSIKYNLNLKEFHYYE